MEASNAITIGIVILAFALLATFPHKLLSFTLGIWYHLICEEDALRQDEAAGS